MYFLLVTIETTANIEACSCHFFFLLQKASSSILIHLGSPLEVEYLPPIGCLIC